MSNDDKTQLLPTDDPINQLLLLVRGLDARLDSIDARLGSLEEKVDKRLQEPRPIWESVQQQLIDMRSDMKSNSHSFDIKLGQLITDMRSDMESNSSSFGVKFDQLIRDMFEYRATLSDLNNRVDKLEEKAS